MLTNRIAVAQMFSCIKSEICRCWLRSALIPWATDELMCTLRTSM